MLDCVMLPEWNVQEGNTNVFITF